MIYLFIEWNLLKMKQNKLSSWMCLCQVFNINLQVCLDIVVLMPVANL